MTSRGTRESNGSRDAEISESVASPTSPRYNSIPWFQYERPKIGRHDFGTIEIGHEIFHKIDDMGKFYAALGYDKDAKVKELNDDEFVWDRYTRDKAKMSPQCLQVQIAVYLHNHSPKFNELYGQAYDAMIGKCCLSVLEDGDEHCANCPMNPRNGRQ
jgi:hypothetical protein